MEKFPEPVFLFKFKQNPLLRPKSGDVLTNPLTFAQFKIIRDEPNLDAINLFRVTHDGDTRVTHTGDTRISQSGADPETVTHNYFVTPANNPNRIESWSRSGFANDQTLRQLFR